MGRKKNDYNSRNYRYKCKFCDTCSISKEIMKKHIISEHELEIMEINHKFNYAIYKKED